MKKEIVKATAVIFILSVTAKLIGFAKSIIQAIYYGTTLSTDAYNIANGTVSSILYMLTTAIGVAFIPIYIQKKEDAGPETAKIFSTRIITNMFLGAFGLVIILEILAPVIMKLMVPFYSGERLTLTIQMFRVLIIGYIFSLAASLYQNLLNAEKVYGFSNFCSIINSIVLMTVVIVMKDKIEIWALVVAMPISFFFQFILLYIQGNKFAAISFKYGIWDKSIKVLVIQTFPIIVSHATIELNQIVDRALLTSMGEGVITAISYSAILYQFVVHILNIPLSTVMFTEFSEAAARGDKTTIKLLLSKMLQFILLISLPILIVVIFASYDIVNVVYGHGNFNDAAVGQSAMGLFGYIFCLIPVIIKNVLTRAYYALNDTRRPMIMGISEVGLNIVLSILWAKPFGIMGVVGATAIASIAFIAVMIIDFNHTYINIVNKNLIKEYGRLFLATGMSLVIMHLFKDMVFVNSLITLIVKTLVCFSVYGITLMVIKEPMLTSAIKKIIERFFS